MATKKVEKSSIAKATVNDFDVIVKPHITEKTMALMQNENKVTVIVKKNATKELVKDAFERIFGVHVKEVKVINVASKEKSRGGRYKGFTNSFKKAVIALAEGEAVDLFKE